MQNKPDLGDSIKQTLNTQVEKKMTEAKKNLKTHVDQELHAIDIRATKTLEDVERQQAARTSEVTNLQDRLAYCEGSLTFIGQQYESM